MASVIQKFDLSLVDPSYTLEIKQTLTVKPKDLFIRAAPRAGAVHLQATPSSALMVNRDAVQPVSGPKSMAVERPSTGLPFYVLYGSNTGTSEAFAQRIANEAPSYGAFRLLNLYAISFNASQDSARRSARWIRRWGRSRRTGLW
jgi:cytochrome P450/NADPH-cytochrome P450 reductase